MRKKNSKNISEGKENEQQHHQNFSRREEMGGEESQRKMGLSLPSPCCPHTMCSVPGTLCLSFPNAGSWDVGGQEAGGRGQDP